MIKGYIMQRVTSYKKICAAFISGCIFLTACENNTAEVNKLNSKNLGVEEGKNVDINYTLSGKAKAKLLSPLMLRVQDTVPYVEFPKKLHVDFYDDSGVVSSRLDAYFGKYYESQSKVFLKDSVKVINVLGDTLYCNELWWDRNKKDHEFFTDKPVRIRTRSQVIDGVGMDARQDFKEYHITVIKGFVKVPKSEFPAN